MAMLLHDLVHPGYEKDGYHDGDVAGADQREQVSEERNRQAKYLISFWLQAHAFLLSNHSKFK